jgi:hypothetical protein
MPTLTKACPLCGALLERSPGNRRWYALGDGSPHACAVVELAPAVAIECCCGAHVERDRDGVKWEHGESHVCSVRAAVPIGERGKQPRPAETRAKEEGAAIGSASAALPRSSPATRPPDPSSRQRPDLLPRVLGA